jgi:hypothetical protein
LAEESPAGFAFVLRRVSHHALPSAAAASRLVASHSAKVRSFEILQTAPQPSFSHVSLIQEREQLHQAARGTAKPIRSFCIESLEALP